MISSVRFRMPWRHLLVAALLALGLLFLFPGKSEAHAILVRADPAPNAVLPVAPDQVRMWFSEAFNPALSTAVAGKEAHTPVDIGGAHASQNDATEIDVCLTPGLATRVH